MRKILFNIFIIIGIITLFLLTGCGRGDSVGKATYCPSTYVCENENYATYKIGCTKFDDSKRKFCEYGCDIKKGNCRAGPITNCKHECGFESFENFCEGAMTKVECKDINEDGCRELARTGCKDACDNGVCI